MSSKSFVNFDDFLKKILILLRENQRNPTILLLLKALQPKIINFIYLQVILMKLDNREKYDKLRRFITELKQKKSIEPFLDLEQIPKYGIYDFWYVNKNPPSFAKIEKKIKDSKYDELAEFLEDLKQIFVAVSDYAFSEDPIQKVCDEFREQIQKFGLTFFQEFKPVVQMKIVKPPKPVPAPPKVKVQKQPTPPPPARPQIIKADDILFRERASTLSEKLQMIFHLRANQNNQPYLRSIGTHYGMGTQQQDQYILSINDKNKLWMQFLQRGD